MKKILSFINQNKKPSNIKTSDYKKHIFKKPNILITPTKKTIYNKSRLSYTIN